MKLSEILTEVVSHGELSLTAGEELIFINSSSLSSRKQKKFDKEEDLDNYLLSEWEVLGVDSWKIEDNRTNAVIYKRKNIYDEIETFNSVNKLYTQVSIDCGGFWKQKNITTKEVVYIHDESSLFVKKFTVIIGKSKACEVLNAKNEARIFKNKVMAGVLSAMMLNAEVLPIEKHLMNSNPVSTDEAAAQSNEGFILPMLDAAKENLLKLFPTIFLMKYSQRSQSTSAPAISTGAFFVANMVAPVKADEQRSESDFSSCKPNMGTVGKAALVGGVAGARAGRAAGPAGMALGAGAGATIGGVGALVHETSKSVDCMSKKMDAQKDHSPPSPSSK